MTRTRLVIALVIGVLLTGFTAIPPSDTSTPKPTGTPTVEPRDTTPAEWTVTNATCRELEQRNPPEVPENLTRRRAVQFVEAYLNATVWNRLYPGKERADVFVATVEHFILDNSKGGYVIHTSYISSSTTCDSVAIDGPFHETDFFINESMLAVNGTILGNSHRSAEHSHTTAKAIVDNGTILEQWNEGRVQVRRSGKSLIRSIRSLFLDLMAEVRRLLA